MSSLATASFAHRLAFLTLLAGGGSIGTAAGQETGPDLRPEIFGILFQRCWQCHTDNHREGGLSLENRAGLQAGGFSGKSLLDRPPADNELLKRIDSDDPGYRMPKGQPPLRPDERKKMAAWLTQGAP